MVPSPCNAAKASPAAVGEPGTLLRAKEFPEQLPKFGETNRYINLANSKWKTTQLHYVALFNKGFTIETCFYQQLGSLEAIKLQFGLTALILKKCPAALMNAT